MKKNVASQVVGAQMVSASDGSAFTGSVTCSVTGDGGTQATGSVGSGACTHEGNGFHTYAPAQAETNYDHVAFTFTGSGAIPVTVQIYTSFPQSADVIATVESTIEAEIAEHAASPEDLGMVVAAGTIGGTGNDSTHLHLAGLTQGDDELNNLLILVHDVSEDEYHSRWILDWDESDALATVASLPFTPEDSTDTYVILSMRQDVTGGSGLDAAGVRAALGMDSANLDTQLGAIASDAGDAKTAAESANGKIGTPVASVSDDIAAVQAEAEGVRADTEDLQARVPAALTAGGKMPASFDEVKGNALTSSKPYDEAE